MEVLPVFSVHLQGNVMSKMKMTVPHILNIILFCLGFERFGKI